MYQATAIQLSPDEIAEGLRLATRLGPQPGPGGSGMTDSAPTCAAFAPVLARWLSGHLDTARIVGLWPSQQIPRHVDAPIVGRRYHLPLQTNDGCWVLHAGHWRQLDLGRLYAMDPTAPHGAVNWGDTVRLHLLIDIVPRR